DARSKNGIGASGWDRLGGRSASSPAAGGPAALGGWCSTPPTRCNARHCSGNQNRPRTAKEDKMNLQLATLLRQIEDLPPRPGDLASFVVAFPGVRTLPPPAPSWLMFAMIEYQQRRAWAYKSLRRRVVRPLLRQHQGGRSRYEILDSFAAGPVPGLPGWTFRLNTDRSALKNESLQE